MSLTDQHRIEIAADNCEVLRARLAKYEDAEGNPIAQPAVVVLPDPKKEIVAWGHDMGGNYDEGHADGWNDALDEVARLNSSPVSACWMMPTAQQLEQALESVPSFHDLSAELIAPAMFEHLRDVISAGEFGDAYRGARDESLIWKRRALEAEAKIREQDQIIENLGNALNEESGPTFMGEPVFSAGVVDDRAADALEFADIEGFPEYKVSSDGIIYRKENGNLISQQSNDKGYLTVNLSNACGPVRMTTHRVVLESFVGKRPEGMQARHVDGNPANNRLSNLCWGTAAENEADKAMHGTKAVGSKNGASKLTEEMVREIIAARDSGGRFWGAKAFAEKFGVNLSTIIRVASGRHWAETSAALSAPSHGEQVQEVVPAGWKLVPVEPTPEMLAAGDKYIGTPATYKSMLSACPSPAITKDFSQFLSAVMDAAGLIRHGRQSKELSEYLGMKCMEYRGVALSASSHGEQVREWIPVSERLPEPWTDVLAYGVNHRSHSYVVAGVFSGTWASQETEEATRFEPTHWMPLPAAPSAGSQEQGE